jgi:hypothetical protein
MEDKFRISITHDALRKSMQLVDVLQEDLNDFRSFVLGRDGNKMCIHIQMINKDKDRVL